jgi:hypothetical protein
MVNQFALLNVGQKFRFRTGRATWQVSEKFPYTLRFVKAKHGVYGKYKTLKSEDCVDLLLL